MNFNFSHNGLDEREKKLERFLEVLPGLTSWTVLIGLFVLAVFAPVLAALIIVVFDFYWLLRLFYLTIFLVISYFRLSTEKSTDWLKRIDQIDRIKRGVPVGLTEVAGFKRKISEWIFSREIIALKKSNLLPPLSSDILHLVIIPVFRESREVLEPGIQSHCSGSYSAKRILVVFAVEERSPEEVKTAVADLCEKYREMFFDVFFVIHPVGLAGEACVKGANATFSAKKAFEYLQQKAIPSENVIVSCFDADTVVSPDYFACLTYSFMVCPQRDRASFQPIPVYHNNIWDVPGFARILEMGASFFQLTEATHPDRLVTFSSHSMSFKALVDVGYWPVDMVSDDSAIFWKAFLQYEGDYRTVPIYVTLSMDVADAGSWWKTSVFVYKQKRRWAWGVENFPIVARGFLKPSKISVFERLRHGLKLFEGHIAWATWPFILGIMGWLPALFAGREFSDSVIFYTVPRIAHVIFNLASIALFTTIILSLCLLPKKKDKFILIRWFVHILEWLAVPLVAIVFSALPALDAQTRLMLGKYMEFWVTGKRRG